MNNGNQGSYDVIKTFYETYKELEGVATFVPYYSTWYCQTCK
mgnify:CR=1 FL=1